MKTAYRIIILAALATALSSCTIYDDSENHSKLKAAITLSYDLADQNSSNMRVFVFDKNNTLYLDTLILSSALKTPEGVGITYLYDGHYTVVSWSNTDGCTFPQMQRGVSTLNNLKLSTESKDTNYGTFGNVGFSTLEFDIAKGDALRFEPVQQHNLIGVDVEITGLDKLRGYQELVTTCEYVNAIDFSGEVTDRQRRTLEPDLTLKGYSYTGKFYTPYLSDMTDFIITIAYSNGELLYRRNIGQALAEALAKQTGSTQQTVDLKIAFTATTVTCTLGDWSETTEIKSVVIQ